uniref:Uncharacterized protein n=1 Tax=Apis cerana TaxID=7461 RepID=V9IFT2_APICE
MDKLLDRDVHQLIKSPILSSYYTSNPPTKSEMTRYLHDEECSSPLAGTDAGNGDSVVGTSSRPHSSTSAELETGMNTLTVQPQIVQQPVPTRTKETRYKAREYIHQFPINHQKQVHTLCAS